MTTSSTAPSRCDIWDADLSPTIGSEIKKIRPVVIVNSNAINKLPIKLVAPITEWNNRFINSLWHVKIEPNGTNGLSKTSSVDVLQLRGLDQQRFRRKKGRVSSTKMKEITAAIAAVIEYE